MNNIQKLATASWAVPLLYAFMAPIAAFVVGRALADMLVLVIAVAGGVAALVCLIAMTRYGRKGILLPAIGGLLVCGIVLGIWIPNYLAAREHARSRTAVN